MGRLTEAALAEFDKSRDLNRELLDSIEKITLGRGARKTEFIFAENGTVRRRVTLEDGTVESDSVLSGTMAARLRSGLSQRDFATLLGVSVRTLQEWEQGRRHPSGAAKTLLRIAEKRPEILREFAELG